MRASLDSLRLTIKLAALRSETATKMAARRPKVAAGILSARAAARRLGIGRDTLAQLVCGAKIDRVAKGKAWGFRAVDVERLVSEGYTLGGPAPAKAARLRAKTSATAVARSIAELKVPT